MPSSSAGVMSFYDEERSSIRLKPIHVVIMTALVALTVMLLEFGVFG
jgi:preprotein translocase subunit Sec61beta